MSTQETATEAIQNPESQFGLCPECNARDGFVHIGRQEWFYCKEHKTKWCTSENMLSGWREMSEKDFQENADMLKDYTEVEPWTNDVGEQAGEWWTSHTIMVGEFLEMLNLYRNLNTQKMELNVNGKQMDYLAKETLASSLCDHVLPGMIHRIAKRLEETFHKAVRERNAEIDGIEF